MLRIGISSAVLTKILIFQIAFCRSYARKQNGRVFLRHTVHKENAGRPSFK